MTTKNTKLDISQIRRRRKELQDEIIRRLRALPELSYKNNTPMFDINGVNVTPVDVIIASLMAKNNMLFVGYMGKVKSDIADVYIRRQWFNNAAVFLRGRTDLNVQSAFVDLDLSKARTSDGTDKDIYVINNARNYQLFIVDEINRCPLPIQQLIFSIEDGHIDLNGKKVYLGKELDNERDRYSVVIAAANIGAAYDGTFKIDRALLDRNVIIDFDKYPTDGGSFVNYELNDLEIKSSIKDSNADFPELYRLFREYCSLVKKDIAEYGLRIAIIAEFLRSGVTYCKKGCTNKANIEYKIRHTDFCEKGCHNNPVGCKYLIPVFERGVDAVVKQFLALDLVTRSKMKEDSELNPDEIYSGILKVYAFKQMSLMKALGVLDEIMVQKPEMMFNEIEQSVIASVSNKFNEVREDVSAMLNEAKRIIEGTLKDFSDKVKESVNKKGELQGVYEAVRMIAQPKTRIN